MADSTTVLVSFLRARGAALAAEAKRLSDLGIEAEAIFRIAIDLTNKAMEIEDPAFVKAVTDSLPKPPH